MTSSLNHSPPPEEFPENPLSHVSSVWNRSFRFARDACSRTCNATHPRRRGSPLPARAVRGENGVDTLSRQSSTKVNPLRRLDRVARARSAPVVDAPMTSPSAFWETARARPAFPPVPRRERAVFGQTCAPGASARSDPIRSSPKRCVRRPRPSLTQSHPSSVRRAQASRSWSIGRIRPALARCQYFFSPPRSALTSHPRWRSSGTPSPPPRAR